MKDVVTIVGSFRFKDQMLAICNELSRKDKMVFLPNMETGENAECSTMIDIDMVELQKRKIDMSEALYVAAGPDMDNFHIGYSTTQEIDHALAKGVPVYYVIGDGIEPEPCKAESEE